jgi:UDP-glucose 4-epimerase
MGPDLDQFTDSSASPSAESVVTPSVISASSITTPDESERSDDDECFSSLDGGHEHQECSNGPDSAGTALQFILVIGGLGYIGSHTSLELLKAGFNVIIVDNLSNSYEEVSYNIKKLAEEHYSAQGGSMPLLHFHKLDYRSGSMRFLLESYGEVVPSSLHSSSQSSPSSPGRSRLTYMSRIAGVIHFAASKSVVDSMSRALHYYRNNVCGLVSLLDLLERYGIRNLVFSSSATIYGTRAESGQPLREEDLVHHPEPVEDASGGTTLVYPKVEGLTSPYARTKYFCEAILADVAAADPLWRIIALRYFNPVGCEPTGLLGEHPRSKPTNLFPVLTQVLTGSRPVLDIYGSDYATKDGTPIRDFVHVVDVAKGHIAALKPLLSPASGDSSTPSPSFRTYNLGSGNGTTVLDAVRSLEGASGMTIPLRLSGRRPGDVGFCVASNDRARTELNWEPQENLERCARDSWNFVRRKTMSPPLAQCSRRPCLRPPLAVHCVRPADIALPPSPILEAADDGATTANLSHPESSIGLTASVPIMS